MKQKTKTKNDNENPRYPQRVLLAAVVVLLVIFNYFYFRDKISSNNEQITAYTERTDPMEQYRNPAVAGLFYAADAAVLEREVAHYLQNGGTSLSALPKILIVPHAGYRYSAPAAAKAYRPLAAFADKVKTVLLLGPSHRVPVDGTALSSADYFATPLGRVPVDKDIVRRLADLPGFAVNNAAHRDEHSLEVQLPFLQKVLTDFSIVPMVYGDANPQETAEALLPLLQKPDTVLVVSADLSHYYPYETAKELDAQTAACRRSAGDRLSCVLRRGRHQFGAYFGRRTAFAPADTGADKFRRHFGRQKSCSGLRRLGFHSRVVGSGRRNGGA